jgi:hypothetical protein
MRSLFSVRRSFRWSGLIVLTAFLLLIDRTAGAQVITGSLFGTVKDESDAVLPATAVRLSSPALIGGPGSTVTNEKGQFRLPELAPGVYTLEIERTGFASYREEELRVAVGGSIERTVILKLAGIADSVDVEGQGSLIEARRSGRSSRYGTEQLKSIPVRRYSIFDFIKAAPGVSPTSASSGTNNSVSVFGSGVNENAFLLDGTNFTCPCSGGAAPQPDVDVIEEIQIESLGASAEYGNIQGAVFNVVTKQGGNIFQYDASSYGQTDGLTGHPIQLACVRCTEAETAYTRVRYRDGTTHLGGPILRDRLWFFGGYQYLRDYDSQPGTDPRFPRADKYDKVFAKATWQITPSLKLLSSFHDEFWVSPERPTLSKPFETTVRISGSRPTGTFVYLTHVLSSNTVWDARMSRFVAPQESVPSTGDRTIPNRFDTATGLSSGGPLSFGNLTLFRTTTTASLSHYRTNLLSGDHELKVGTQIEDGKHDGYTAFPGGVQYTDRNGQPFQAVFSQPSTTGGEFMTLGTFAMDSVRVGGRLTLDLGIRYDHSRGISPDLPARGGEGHETGATIRGLGTLYTWNVVAPRLGLALKLTPNGRTILRTNYGRFYQGTLTGDLTAIHPGLTPTTTKSFDPATGQYSTIVSVVDPTINLRIDPNTKAPRTDQFSIGVDRELASRLAVTAAYVHKAGRDFIGWTDTGGIYQAQTRTLSDGRTVPVLVLANSTADRRFLKTNPPEYFLRYNGMMLTLERRWADRWQALASYTFSKVEGLQPSSGATPGSSQVSSLNTFGRDPNSLTNAIGTLPNDRTHMFRLMGSVEIPRTGLVLATNLQHFTGLPWAATAQISLPQGLQRVLLEPRGSRRLSSQTLLDLRLSKTVRLAGHGQIELLLDVLNVLNQKAEEGLADDNLFSQNFARPSAFVDPRRAMLGVRLTLPK